ncbi:hypothetical protein OG21DRAFT_632820 [Imleria badia]|nr:hypothetical protein OG21DRAFT_632820 [Imleria badia]
MGSIARFRASGFVVGSVDERPADGAGSTVAVTFSASEDSSNSPCSSGVLDSASASCSSLTGDSVTTCVYRESYHLEDRI